MENAIDPYSVNIKDINTVFNNDSLCIIHCFMQAKNALGFTVSNKIEYVYLESNGTKYEAFKPVQNDSIFQNIDLFNKIKKGKIYESMAYEDALFYRASVFIKSLGRVVGDKEGSCKVNINIPTQTGLWEVGNYIDEFGDDTQKNI